jgi:hypothetical protein
MRVDCIVLGAGVVGVSTALHLQKRGRNTVLVDRRGVSEETSFGNAGLIQREGVYPYGFPHDFGALLRYAMNNTIDAHYHAAAIPKLAPFLFSYWMHSRKARHEAIARHYATLIEHCVSEHDALAGEAGAQHLLRRTGWMKVFRTTREQDARFAEADRWHADFGLNHRKLDAPALRSAEPHLAHDLIGGLHWTEELAVLSFLPATAMPHVHALVDAHEFGDEQLEAVRTSLSNWRNSQGEGIPLLPNLDVRPIHTPRSLLSRTRYLYKPINLSLSYDAAWANHVGDDRSRAWELNSQAREVAAGIFEARKDRNRMHSKGTLDQRNNRFIGIPRNERINHSRYLRSLAQEPAEYPEEIPEVDDTNLADN